MEALLDVYERAFDEDRPVVAIDESPQQLVSEVRTGFIDSKGVRYADYEYKREGVVDLYLISESLAGEREIFVRENHKRFNWAETVRYVAEEKYPQAERITIICDNLSAHKPSALYEILPAEQARQILRRIEFIYTPKHGSWLNVAENELSVLKRVGIGKRVESEEELKKQIADYQERRNKKEIKVDWQFTAKDARVKLKRLYPPIKS